MNSIWESRLLNIQMKMRDDSIATQMMQKGRLDASDGLHQHMIAHNTFHVSQYPCFPHGGETSLEEKAI